MQVSARPIGMQSFSGARRLNYIIMQLKDHFLFSACYYERASTASGASSFVFKGKIWVFAARPDPTRPYHALLSLISQEPHVWLTSGLLWWIPLGCKSCMAWLPYCVSVGTGGVSYTVGGAAATPTLSSATPTLRLATPIFNGFLSFPTSKCSR